MVTSQVRGSVSPERHAEISAKQAQLDSLANEFSQRRAQGTFVGSATKKTAVGEDLQFTVHAEAEDVPRV